MDTKDFPRNSRLERARRELASILRILDAHHDKKEFYILDLEQDFRRAVKSAYYTLFGNKGPHMRGRR